MSSQQLEQTEATAEDISVSAIGARTRAARRDKGGKAGNQPRASKKSAVKPKQATKKGKGAGGRKRTGTKQEKLIAMLRRPEGATVDEVVKSLGWQAHTVRGAISGSLKKKLGLKIGSEKIEGRGRLYRIAD